MPYFGPRDGQYDPADVTLPPNFDNPPSEVQALKARMFQAAYYEGGHSGLPLKTEADWRRMIANYWGLCSQVDTHVGTILDTLQSCGIDDDTIVVFTSDHGDMMGSHRLIAKCVMFEEAVRVPLLLRLPGQTEQHRVPSPVSQVDLVPTLLDYLGQAIPDTLQGRSLRRFMDPSSDADPDDVFIEWNGPNSGIAGDVVGKTAIEEVPDHLKPFGSVEDLSAAIRDPVRTVVTPEGWKFVCSPRGEHELYDLGRDPYETTNLAVDAAQRPRMIELQGRIRAWQERTGDTVELPAL
jgi:arylsulfatase A-like enzyme